MKRISAFALTRAPGYFLSRAGLADVKPWNVIINPTFRCNLRCRQCDMWKSLHGPEMGKESWKQAIADMNKWLGSFYLLISGGEPLLRRDDVLDMISFASRNGLMTGLNTNAWSLDPETIDALGSAGLGTFAISLDGSDAETHDSTRGRKGSFDRILSASGALKNSRGKTRLVFSSVLMSTNIDQVEYMIRLSESEGASIYFQALIDNLGKVSHEEEWFSCSGLWPKPKDATKAIASIKRMKMKGCSILNSRRQLDFLASYYSFPERTLGKLRCGSAQKLFIMPDGSVRLCERMGSIGNIADSSPRRLWYSREARTIRSEINECKKHCMIMNCNFDDKLRDNAMKVFHSAKASL